MNATLEQETPRQQTDPSAADNLRRMADWLDEHPEAEAELMLARYGGGSPPTIKFYKVRALASAFPGRECTKSVFQSSDVYSLTDNGIVFEAWQKREPEQPVETKVTL